MNENKTKMLFQDLSNIKINNNCNLDKDSTFKFNNEDSIAKLLKQSDLIVESMIVYTTNLEEDEIKRNQINYDMQINQSFDLLQDVLREDEQSLLFEEDQITISERILLDAEFLNIDLTQTSHIFQDVLKHFYMTTQLQIICFYPLDNVPQLTQMINLSKIKTLRQHNSNDNLIFSNLSEINGQLEQIQNETLSQIQVKQINERCIQATQKTLIIIPHITPYFAMKEYLSKHEITSEFYGPTLFTNIQFQCKQLNQSAFENQISLSSNLPNYFVKPIVFLNLNNQSQELYLLALLLKICDRGLVFIKVGDIQSLKSIDNFFLNKEFRYKCLYSKKVQKYLIVLKCQLKLSDVEIVITHDIKFVSVPMQQKFKSMIYLNIPSSLTEYINEMIHFNQKCVSFVIVATCQLITQRNALLKDYLDEQTFKNLMEEIQGAVTSHYFNSQNRRINLIQLKGKFMLEEQQLTNILNYLENDGLLKINHRYPTQMRVSLSREETEDNNLELTLIRSIKLNGRKLISLRSNSKTLEHYQVSLKYLTNVFGIDNDQLISIIDSSDLFIEPEYFDFDIDLIVDNKFIPNPTIETKKIYDLEEMYLIIMKFKDTKFTNDLDVNIQIDFEQFINDYFNYEARFKEDFKLPYKSLTNLKQINQLQKDIKLIKEHNSVRNILQILLGNSEDLFKQWKTTDIWSKYSEYNHEEILQQIQLNICEEDQEQRDQGWMMKKIKL